MELGAKHSVQSTAYTVLGAQYLPPRSSSVTPCWYAARGRSTECFVRSAECLLLVRVGRTTLFVLRTRPRSFASASLQRGWCRVRNVVLRSKNGGSVLTHSEALEVRGPSYFVRGTSKVGLSTQDEVLSAHCILPSGVPKHFVLRTWNEDVAQGTCRPVQSAQGCRWG